MRPADAPTLRLVPDRHTARDTSPSGDGHAETTMREQAIQFVGEPGAGGIAATVDAAEPGRLLAPLGGTGPIEIGLAAEDEDDVSGPLFGAGAIVGRTVRPPACADRVGGP